MLSLSLCDFPSPTFTSSYKPKTCLFSGDSKLAGSVDVRACFCLSVGSAIDWQHVQSVPRLSSCDSWDNLQPPQHNPELLVGLELDKQLRN